ncbi:TlpA family protein disulfide reductase [Pedobacter africanus]|uniref:Thiol-disulfide isomerase or thioredoxin n=1 Tax=Pedobacter africanus TaxID=151894 RepID=A0A1W2A2K5_9SPHI|nr:TlpA disulfide reductase family protein [Pedobacter africanus]SMC54692.1 Thiol-disulfide isomerase or thioredoxin [Pedobacter africanus]
MKKKVFLLYLLCAGLTSYAQEWTNKINDPDWHDRRSKGLQLGDKMPDLPLGKVYNNKTGKTRFSEFKGKLVILDFWTSWCEPCIAGFPKMEKLQKEFGDKIQIILVNTTENIEGVIKKYPELKLPDLPSIMKDDAGNIEILNSLLPNSLGHQIWIDKEGVIALRGSALNNTAKNISDFLNGKDIYILKDNSVVPRFDPNYPYSKLLGDFKSTSVKYSSIITTFNNEYQADGKARAENIIDKASGTIRNTYINYPILDLYENAFRAELLTGLKTEIIYYHNRQSSGLMPYLIIPKDTARYSDTFHRKISSGTEYVKNRFCYEQIVPRGISEKHWKVYMQQDLNRYFGFLYGTEAKMEKRIVPCYVLVRTSTKDKLESKAKNRSIVKYNKNGMSLVKYDLTGLGLLGDVIRDSHVLASYFIQNAKKGEAALLLNETGFMQSKSIDLILPESKDLKTIDDLRKALQPYDLDIQLAKREIQFILITDNSDKSI